MIAACSDPKQANRGQHILIVDDEVDAVFPLRQALLNRGFRVSQAVDGNEGLAVIEFDPPALIILDIAMPKRSGLVLLENLREKSDYSNPVIMVTAIDGERHFKYARALGVDEYFQKPYSLDRLIECVERLIASQKNPPFRK